MHVKNDFKVSKIFKSTVLDKSSKKIDAFALNLHVRGKMKKVKVSKQTNKFTTLEF